MSKDPRVKFTLSAKNLKPEQVRTIPFGEWEFKQLEQATLWWVSAEMVDLLTAAIPSVPDDVLTSDLVMPEHTGLVVFEKPWMGTSTDAPDPVPISMCLWGLTRLPPIRSEEDAKRHGLSFYTGGQFPELNAISLSSYTKVNNEWLPLGRSDWPDHQPFTSSPGRG